MGRPGIAGGLTSRKLSHTTEQIVAAAATF